VKLTERLRVIEIARAWRGFQLVCTTLSAVMRGHSRPKDGVASLAYDPRIHAIARHAVDLREASAAAPLHGWPGHRRAKRRRPFGRLCPAMTWMGWCKPSCEPQDRISAYFDRKVAQAAHVKVGSPNSTSLSWNSRSNGMYGPPIEPCGVP
jgi:hypothetical protein